MQAYVILKEPLHAGPGGSAPPPDRTPLNLYVIISIKKYIYFINIIC